MASRATGGKPRFLEALLRALVRTWQGPAFDEPRARTWARQIRSYEELPEVFRSFFDRLPSSQIEPFPYTALMPTFKGGYGRPEIERLVLKAGTDIHVLENPEAGLVATRYPIENIHLVERGSILLHAWITINGQDSNGAFRSTTLRFNSVTDHIMAPFIEAMRAPTTAGSSADPTMERSRLDFLGRTHFKFLSYGQGSIRPGAKVIRIVFQPEVSSELARLFNFSLSRLVSPAHLGILTDSELILIRDDDTQRWSKGSPHGAIWIYMPRRQILQASLSSGSDGGQTLSITLRGGSRIAALFEPSQRRNLEELVGAIRS